MESPLAIAEHPNASALRRFAAMIYDMFLIVAIWMLTTTVVVSLLNQGEAIGGWPFQLMLLLEVFIFFAYFWRIKGQTLGMQVWKIRTENEASETLGIGQSAIRFLLAGVTLLPAGLGFFWMLIDRDRLTAYDRFSKSRVVYLGSKPFAKELLSKKLSPESDG